MKNAVRRPAASPALPDDLAIFESRMRHLGISVRLPDAGPGYAIPDTVSIEGEPLSETVVRLRRGA
ncbi:MAG TPA: hypothetical protein VFE05_00615 [Longimicrobiaceae bacterium]|jgi:hypothetical protein|nr:hypothetical protein [Longimicrobiaceae bacterium]